MFDKKEEGARNKLNPVVFGAIFALIVVALVISPLVKSSVRNNKFSSAVALVEKGDYDGAAAMFAEIKDYKEVEIAEYCRESLAQFCDDKEFEQAWDWVFALSYQELVPDIEVMDMYDRIKYYQAASLADSGAYLEAYEKYVALGNYLDSAEKAEFVWQDHKDVFYDLALSRYNSKNLSNIELAKQEFEKLGDYADSQKYLAEATFITSMCGTYDTGSGDRCVIEVGKLTSIRLSN